MLQGMRMAQAAQLARQAQAAQDAIKQQAAEAQKEQKKEEEKKDTRSKDKKPLKAGFWTRFHDEESGKYFFHNNQSGEVTWHQPEAFGGEEWKSVEVDGEGRPISESDAK
eukprot:180422_1